MERDSGAAAQQTLAELVEGARPRGGRVRLINPWGVIIAVTQQILAELVEGAGELHSQAGLTVWGEESLPSYPLAA